MEHLFRIFDFNIYNEKETPASDSSEDEKTYKKDNSTFMIQMFGLNEKGETCSIQVEDFKPFFYVMVSDKWNTYTKDSFLNYIKSKIGKYYQDSITECIIIKRKKLYGFDGGKEHKFIKFEFKNIPAYNRVKNLWYSDYNNGHKLFKNGLLFENTNIKLYEANIPPLLRLFHIKDISPSGWIALPKKKTIEITNSNSKKTTCNYEFIINYKNIVPLNGKETRVPYKIMSFDIEASSSHGDFPVPVKSYKKLATNIIEYFENLKMDITKELCKNILRRIILAAFGYEDMQNIDLVYPKIVPNSKQHVEDMCEKWLEGHVRTKINFANNEDSEITTIESLFEKMAHGEEDQYEGYDKNKYVKSYTDKKATIVDILCDKKFEREGKLHELNMSLSSNFPKLEGDKVTFIGSTFMNYGEQEPYKNHCVVLNTCSELPVKNSEVESYQTEREVLLAWQQLVQKENPDIVIGYNIFGFDYEFMFRRAEETGCAEEFLKLSRNNEEICGTKDKDTNKFKIEESSIQIASGQHDLKFIKMNGRLQVDLYNFFRREENLTSYKLDYVAGHFIGDYIKNFEHDSFKTEIKTTNLTGLLEGSYIHLEEIGHSVDYYDDGAKFKVISINKDDCKFKIEGIVNPDMKKKVRWCLAKDDVTPKDIFRMTNGTAHDRSVIAKYCIQDCNLVHYLFNKVDVLTGFIEMAKICSVPINFLVMRGQGIKLTSYVAKKCREKRTLIPVIEKGDLDEGYEGAIVLDPKCDLYLDNPVACVDYASLYPSSMISENLSHDSKVWSREYDLAGNLTCETGEKNENGDFMYDNLPGYEYVNITYDTFKYLRKSPKAAAEKVRSGKKICRFAQFPEGKAIMPSILEELLIARKTTRKLIPQQTDEFMKNVLDKRQLGYKVTANSLYGQCGAKTSTFYEKDIAACTTATGRLLLTYAKKIIEECYGDAICNTKTHGPVLTKAEYIYGDSVANYTPVYIKYNERIEAITIEKLAEKYGKDLWVLCKEEGKEEKEFCEFIGLETWTEKGWTKLHRVIRHKLAPHKKMVRVITHKGIVDVTDDHSLLLKNGNEISPKDVNIGTELLHHKLPKINYSKNYYDNYIINIFDISKSTSQIKMANFIAYYQSIGVYTKIVRVNNTSNPNIYKVELFNKYLIHENAIENFDAINNIHEIDYEGYVYDLTTDNHHFAAGIGNLIVHNTDSVFFTFNLQTPEGKPIRGKEALEITIELAQEAGHLASSLLKGPHDLEYEKTFMPFCLLSKKRYVGMLYETDPNKCKRKEMGIVLKRRDNAPIVKDIYGGIIDILMKEQNINRAIEFLQTSLQNIVDEKYSMDKLIITKSLRSGYKNPQTIAHKVLADRMTARDPGNKPGPGDRIPFVYINTTNKKALQGDKIETPNYIKEQGLKIDYSFYITNQIMKPVQQVFALVLEKIWELQGKKLTKLPKYKKEVEVLRKKYSDPAFDGEKFEEKLEDLRNKEIKTLLFDKYLRETNNEKQGVKSITSFFSKI
jgi:DNA polymerase elongation subunit (family B)